MTQATEQLSKGAVTGAVAFGGGYSQEVIEQAAQVGFAAVRELGVSAGSVDLPTWQIALSEIKRDCRLAAKVVLEKSDKPTELIHLKWSNQRRMETPDTAPQTYVPSWTKSWTELTDIQRFQFGLFVSVVRAFEGVNARMR